MKLFLGILVVTGFAIIGVPAPPGDGHHHATTMCLQCHKISDPTKCTHFARCHPDEQCATEVHTVDGQVEFTLSCKPRHECDRFAVTIGRRATGPCRQCCDTPGCNRDLCGAFLPTTTAAPTTAPTTQQDTCRDHEEDGFACASYDMYNFCTDPTAFAHAIAHTKCPKHCGFCDGDGSFAATTAAPMKTTATPVTDATMTTTAAPMTTTAAPVMKTSTSSNIIV